MNINIKEIIVDESGSSTIEYGIVGVVISAAILLMIDDKVLSMIVSVWNDMSSHTSNTDNLLGS